MKIRNSFVSNSSSCSFYKKTKLYAIPEVKKILEDPSFKW